MKNRVHKTSVLCILSAVLSLAALPALAARYATLSPASTPIDAPYTVHDGDLIVTNWVETATATNMVVTTNFVWRITANLPEPTANRLGYYLVVDAPPTPPTGYYNVATGWALEGTPSRITRQYSVLPLPPAPARRIYKYDLSAACIEYGEITNLVTFISADQGVKWMWDCAEILVEDDPYFIAATNEVISSGAIPEAKVKAILDRAYELGQLSSAN